MNKSDYVKYVEKREKRSPSIKNCLFAFLSGGTVCVLGRALHDLYTALSLAEKTSSALSSVTLIFLSSLLTGIGIYPKIARHCGAGLFVPITGFSNSITSSAIEAKSEGFIMGVGAEMFRLAGPVIVYGNLSAVLYGVVYYIVKCLK